MGPAQFDAHLVVVSGHGAAGVAYGGDFEWGLPILDGLTSTRPPRENALFPQYIVAATCALVTSQTGMDWRAAMIRRPGPVRGVLGYAEGRRPVIEKRRDLRTYFSRSIAIARSVIGRSKSSFPSNSQVAARPWFVVRWAFPPTISPGNRTVNRT